VAVRHGATASLRLTPRAEELADGLRAIVPCCSEADEPSICLLAGVLARIEAANEYLAEQGLFLPGGGGELQPLLRVLTGWENTAARLCDRLGLTPTSRAALGLDLVRARGEALREHLQDTYGDER
jgi:hypothetical protein